MQYHDIVKQRVTDMYHRDRAFMEQIKSRFTPSGPPILQLLKRKPLEWTVFMPELRYPPIHVQVTPPVVVGRILWFDKGHHHPKDMENVHDDGDTESFPKGGSIVPTLQLPGRQPGPPPSSAELHSPHLGGHGGALLSLGQGHLRWARLVAVAREPIGTIFTRRSSPSGYLQSHRYLQSTALLGSVATGLIIGWAP